MITPCGRKVIEAERKKEKRTPFKVDSKTQATRTNFYDPRTIPSGGKVC
jgi:hypothetical protein